jgi:hypothetical protein
LNQRNNHQNHYNVEKDRSRFTKEAKSLFSYINDEEKYGWGFNVYVKEIDDNNEACDI